MRKWLEGSQAVVMTGIIHAVVTRPTQGRLNMPPSVKSNQQTDVKHLSFTVSCQASNPLATLHLQSAHAVTMGRKHQNIHFNLSLIHI